MDGVLGIEGVDGIEGIPGTAAPPTGIAPPGIDGIPDLSLSLSSLFFSSPTDGIDMPGIDGVWAPVSGIDRVEGIDGVDGIEGIWAIAPPPANIAPASRALERIRIEWLRRLVKTDSVCMKVWPAACKAERVPPWH